MTNRRRYRKGLGGVYLIQDWEKLTRPCRVVGLTSPSYIHTSFLVHITVALYESLLDASV